LIPRFLPLFFFLPFLAGASPEPGPLVVGMELNYPPFEMTDAAGKPCGLSVELAEELAQSIHRSLRIENLAFDGLIPALLTDKIDLVISSLTITPERSKAIAFSRPYAHIGLALLTRKDPTIQTAKDLDKIDRTIITKRGTSGHVAAEKLFPKAKHLVVDQDAAAYLEVSQGKADAFLYDQLSVARAQERYSQTTQALLTSLQEENWAFGLRQKDKELQALTETFLLSFQKKGGFQRLAAKYLSKEEGIFRKAGIPFIFSPIP
jgi:polar amino acid transport system substrate-binding protein